MLKTRRATPPRILIGWREWVHLPDLMAEPVKAKIDTGAQTSALHAQRIRAYAEAGEPWVTFLLHPQQKKRDPEFRCHARILDQRVVTSSNGQRERRFVIGTTLCVGEARWPIELTLTNRDTMSYRMLLGRQALRRHCLIHPGRSFLLPARPGASAD